jgi:hypothetical protein
MRPTDRGPQPKRHEGPYYGFALRRIINAEHPESKKDRDSQMAWLVVLISVALAVLAAALIVIR